MLCFEDVFWYFYTVANYSTMASASSKKKRQMCAQSVEARTKEPRENINPALVNINL